MKSNITIITPPEGWTEAWAKLGMDIINARVAGKQKQKDKGSIWRIPFHHYDADPKTGKHYPDLDNPEHNERFLKLMDDTPWAKYINKICILEQKQNRHIRCHRDRDRAAAVNVPIAMPKDIDKAWVGSSYWEWNNDIDRTTRIPAGVDDGKNQFPPWEHEHKCHEYNMAKPIVLNTHAWHWVRNNTAELRAIVSLDVSIDDIDYDKFVDELIEMKWIDQETMYNGIRYLEDTEKYCKPNQSHRLYNPDEHQGGVELF